jgi:hypothetical protein
MQYRTLPTHERLTTRLVGQARGAAAKQRNWRGMKVYNYSTNGFQSIYLVITLTVIHLSLLGTDTRPKVSSFSRIIIGVWISVTVT